MQLYNRLGLLIVLLFLASCWLPWLAPPAPAASPAVVRIAILPFATPKGRTDLEQYGEGMMDSLITALVNVPQFQLIDRGRIDRVLKEQAFAMTGLVDAKTAVKTGKLLAAQVLVGGSLAVAGKQVRITATFTEVATGVIQQSRQVTGALEDIFDMQDQLAQQFIQNRQAVVTAAQKQQIQQVLKSTDSLLAYDLYLKGRKAYLKMTPFDLNEAIAWYNKAIAADEKYALAYSGVAEAWVWLGMLKRFNQDNEEEDMRRAVAAADKALAINPRLPEAIRARAISGFPRLITGEFKQRFEAQLKQALAINPNDAEAWLWLGMNERDPNNPQVTRALALNPDLVIARFARGFAYASDKQWVKAEQEMRQVLALSPGFYPAYFVLGGILIEGLNRPKEAIPLFERFIYLAPNSNKAEKIRAFLQQQGR